MRKEAVKDGDNMLKFISYSNVDPKVAKEHNKSSQGRNSYKSNSPLGRYSPGSL